MPAAYAHYRFGCRVLPTLSPGVQSCIRRFRRMYDLGLHGPDFLFFHNPLAKDPLFQTGNRTHMMTGRAFFTRAVRQLRMVPSESAASYLYGVLTHFTLDSICHPFIQQCADSGAVSHMALESELDRHLLECDGKPKPHEVCLTGHIRLDDPQQARQIAMFYAGVTADQVAAAMKRFRFLMDFCTAPKGIKRNLIEKGAFSHVARDATMMTHPDPRCASLLPELEDLIRQAEQAMPDMAAQLTANISCGKPFGTEFDRIFG